MSQRVPQLALHMILVQVVMELVTRDVELIVTEGVQVDVREAIVAGNVTYHVGIVATEGATVVLLLVKKYV